LSTVLVSIISSLEGRIASNPKVLSIYPNTLDVMEETIIQKSLPLGATPDEFYESNIGSYKILVYIFEILNVEGRNDLVSIGFILDKNVIAENLRPIIKHMIKWLKSENLLTYEIIQENLPKIIEGINNKSIIVIKNSVFNVSCDAELEEKSRKVKGMF
jgi:hypothetical protein